MRVLYDHQTFSHQRFGGNSRYFFELLSCFYRTGDVSIELAVESSPNEYLKGAPFFAGRASQHVDLPHFLARYARNEIATRLAARRPHDVFHTTFYYPTALHGAKRAKLVVTVLDMIPELFPESFELRTTFGRFVTKPWIEGKRQLCARADAILAISETTKRDVVKFYGIDPDRITVTHLANRLSADARTPRVTGFPDRYVLFVGTRNTYKNFSVFLQGVAGSKLPIVCIGGGAFDAAELAQIKALGLDALQRNVADHELPGCYAHAAAFVFPSRYEGFGIPILEAMACGAPTILANASCFPEIAGDAALYFDPADPADLARVLERVIGDRQLADELRARGHARAERFTWEATAARTLAVYQGLRS
jgi:glycosyltransferase involved in cell wall biosynthesis